MKRVLILVIGCSLEPWDVMPATAAETWDKEPVDGLDVITYFGQPVKPNTEKAIYFDIEEGFERMGHKLLNALRWCLENKDFDILVRINSSTYINKQELNKYVQGLPATGLFEGLEVKGTEQYGFSWCWGGLPFLISKDVVHNLVVNSDYYDHQLIEDVAISKLANRLGVKFKSGTGCSIDKVGNEWRMLQYGHGQSFTFSAWEDVKKAEGQFAFRVKQDDDRTKDKFIMQRLYENL